MIKRMAVVASLFLILSQFASGQEPTECKALGWDPETKTWSKDIAADVEISETADGVLVVKNNYREWNKSKIAMPELDIRSGLVSMEIRASQECSVGVGSISGAGADSYVKLPGGKDWRKVRISRADDAVAILVDGKATVPLSYGEADDRYQPFVVMFADSSLKIRNVRQIREHIGTVISVVDGDTLIVAIGRKKERVRLRRVNAPELDEEGGPEARAALKRRFPTGRKVVVTTHARDKYGRAVADVRMAPKPERTIPPESKMPAGRQSPPKILKVEYDKFKDITSVETMTRPLKLEKGTGGHEVHFVARYKGTQPAADTGIEMWIVCVSSDWRYLRAGPLEGIMMIDGGRFTLTDPSPYSNVGDYRGGNCFEIVSFELSPDIVARMVSAKKVEMQISLTEFTLPGIQADARKSGRFLSDLAELSRYLRENARPVEKQ